MFMFHACGLKVQSCKIIFMLPQKKQSNQNIGWAKLLGVDLDRALMSGFLKECRKVKLSIEPDGPADVCPNCGGV
jgi:hypothetical protein